MRVHLSQKLKCALSAVPKGLIVVFLTAFGDNTARMGNCNCCEEDPPPTVTIQNANPTPFNHHFPATYPSAPPSTHDLPPVTTIYPPLPPQVELCAPPPFTPEPSYYWSSSSFGGVPPLAVKAGIDKSGEEIYVGKANHEGDSLPAKIVPSHRCAYVAWGGLEHKKEHYDVLCAQSSSWLSGRNGEVPDNAVQCGQALGGEALFVGRVIHDGTLTPGKVHPSHGCIYIPYGGQELSFPEYEVLVIH